MSDTREGQGAPFVQQPAANDGVTAGTLLRRAREAAGLHVAALAVSLKVPVRKLEALEDDRWDDLTDAVFVRALASSVCRSLQIDPQPILERLPRKATTRLIGDDECINTPFRAPSDGAPPSWLDHLRKPVFLSVFALLLGALVLVLLPAAQPDNHAVTTAVSEAVPSVTTVVVPHPAASQAMPAPAEPAPATTPATTPSPGATADPSQGATAPPTPPTGMTMASTAAATAPAASQPLGAASSVIVFRTKGPSWVEVTDAKGAVALRKVLETGESVSVNGALPLHVTVGRVDQTEVQVRGMPYDLKPVSKDNVARFEVK